MISCDPGIPRDVSLHESNLIACGIISEYGLCTSSRMPYGNTFLGKIFNALIYIILQELSFD